MHAPGEADLNLYAYVHGRVLVAVDLVGLDDGKPANPTPVFHVSDVTPPGQPDAAVWVTAPRANPQAAPTMFKNYEEAKAFAQATPGAELWVNPQNMSRQMLNELTQSNRANGQRVANGSGGACTGGDDCLGGGTMRNYSLIDKFAMGVGMYSAAGADPSKGVSGGVPGGTGDPSHASGAGQAAWGTVQLFGHKVGEVVAKTALKYGGIAITAGVGAVITRAKRLEQLVQDARVSRADAGWISNEIRQVEQGNVAAVRNPPGKELRHPPGRASAQGYDYSETQLQDVDLHDTQHRYLVESSDGTSIRMPKKPPKPGPNIP